jgi:two-component system OmpR family sensor kinase
MTGDRRTRLTAPHWSVRSRILASILIVAALGLVLAGAVTYVVQRTRTLDSVDARLTSRVSAARTVAGRAAARGESTTMSALLQAVVTNVVPNANESSIAILDGTPRWKSIPTQSAPLALDADRPFVAQAVREVANGKPWLGTARLGSRDIRYVAVPITLAGSSDTGIYVDAVDLDAELSGIRSAFTTYALVAAIALVAIGLVGWFVAGRLLRPIRRLREAASRITASQLDERIPVAGHDDVSILTETVNGMLDRLDTAMTSQRQLLDDVRHELKTPITIIRGHLELLDADTAADVEATRALAIDELDRMSGLVDDIEALAETQRATLRLTPVDVADLTADVFAKVSALTGHDWQLEGTAEAIVPLDAGRVTQAWLQLADNAAKYSPDGSAIVLGSRLVDDSVEFWVSDSGRGIPRESWGRIFERFGRVDAGRGIRGSGLGLPIVAAIAEGHGGRVTLASSTAGSRFALLLPLIPTAELRVSALPEAQEKPKLATREKKSREQDGR